MVRLSAWRHLLIGVIPIDDTVDAIAQMRNVKVDQQAHGVAVELQI